MNLVQNLSNVIAPAQSDAVAEAAEKAPLFDFSELSDMALSEVIAKVSSGLIDIALKILVAVLVFYAGRFIVKKIINIVNAILVKNKVDLTLGTFVLSVLNFVLYFLLLIIIIGVLGINTSSFIALFASAGVAIGMALSGTLQNFAGGVLILLLKPYKVGDFIETQGLVGTVKEIQIFYTILNTVDNKSIVIPNGKLSSNVVNNASRESYRRVEWKISIAYGDDIDHAKEVALGIMNSDDRSVSQCVENDSEIKNEELKLQEKKRGAIYKFFHKHNKLEKLAAKVDEIPSIKRKTVICEPFVALSELADSSINITMRAWTRSENYWGVYFTINERIYKEFPKAGLNFPYPHLDVTIDK